MNKESDWADDLASIYFYKTRFIAYTEHDMAEFAAALRTAYKRGRVEELRYAAEISDPPLMHRKGNIGLWRKRRAEISVTIRNRADDLEKSR